MGCCTVSQRAYSLQLRYAELLMSTHLCDAMEKFTFNRRPDARKLVPLFLPVSRVVIGGL